ncbi:cytochrome P450 [Aspergillus brunneoviolaceus CBS 621.78]|uniref:Cytochrome P450 n=1 Tax=Aspergillus brunneoviolaceus CBS 621.78 TaxID=1450534 RepID=A0ACD1G081_9EURO|nr:cytochrome P450 [Aspergillus brunneoviolaceus CBS 621.78]RAH42636.1 cytochrome P450 [Aspergillus brunneoviolaceus CBS 621.78]
MGLIISIALVALAATIAWLVYTYFLSPLASIPNAGILAPVSRKITLKLSKLHQRLGLLVRIGPNQILFYSLDIYKTVHAPNSPFVKDPRDGHPALFSITNTKEHAQRRRHMGILFNRSKVPALTEIILEQIDKWIVCLSLATIKGPIDLGPSCRALESDIVCELAVIKENDLKSSKMSVYVNFPLAVGLWYSVAAWIYRLSDWEVFSVISSQRFDKWADSQLIATKDSEKAPRLCFFKVMAGARVSEQSALSEAKEMLGPGTDITSATLAYIIYVLSLNQSFQAGLVAELDASGWPSDMSVLEAIPRLVACVKEGIRWTGAAAVMLPRIVPRVGSSLVGKYLPEGEKNDTTSRRDDYYIPFFKGASTCIGNHFAYLELYLFLSRLLKRYSIHPADLSGANALDHEAVLPPRLEWVAAVPMNRLEVVLQERS